MARTIVCWIISSAILGCSSGCSLFGLDRDLATLRELEYYTGDVRLDGPATSPSFVVLYTAEKGKEQPISFDLLLEGAGVYHIIAPPSDYRLLAFQDTNHNGNYDNDEPFAILPGPPEDAKGDMGEKTRGDLVIPATMPASIHLPDIFGSHFTRLVDRLTRRNGEVTALSDSRFSDMNVRKGVYEPLAFFEDVGPAIYMLQPYDPGRIPVIFVHGMNGSPRSWRAMIEHLDQKRYQPWVFYWPTGMPVEASGWVLDQSIENLRWRYDFHHCHIVAYSMGGLVARTALNIRAAESRRMIVQQFITFSTPWGGHAGSEIGVRMSPVVVPSWRSMMPSGKFIQGLFKETWPDTVTYTLFFTYGRSGGRSKQNDDGVVTLQSMLMPAAQRQASFIYGFNEDHRSVLDSADAMKMLNAVLAKASAPTTQPITKLKSHAK